VVASRDHALAADWVIPYSNAAPPSPRVLRDPSSGQAALELTPGLIALQDLPDVTAEWAQNQTLHFSAHVWTAREIARGAIEIDFGWAKVGIPFTADARGSVVEVTSFVPLYAPYLHVVLRSEEGTIYADRLIAESDRRHGLNILSNPDVAQPAWRFGSALDRLWRYLRLRELEWVWRSGRLREVPPMGWQLPRVMFISFWGQFGWMSISLVGGTPWEGALASICMGGLVGVIGWIVSERGALWQRRAVVLLVLIAAAEVLSPLLFAYTQPRGQALQQGRFCFPALVPIVLLLALGWRALIPARWRAGALIVAIAFGVLFAAAALQLIAGYY
jgi:hypothetical protein